jgi:hypothetical protein
LRRSAWCRCRVRSVASGKPEIADEGRALLVQSVVLAEFVRGVRVVIVAGLDEIRRQVSALTSSSLESCAIANGGATIVATSAPRTAKETSFKEN